MTEEEWLTSEEAPELLGFMSDRARDRKHRLVTCSFSRLVWHLLCEAGREAVRTAEKYAEGEITHEIASETQERVELLSGEGKASPYSPVVWALQEPYTRGSFPPFYVAALAGQQVREVLEDESVPLAHFIRDIFGNPFRPIVVAPEWLTSTVLALATSIYTEKAFDRLPILADALQDAGCDSDDLLNHLRSDGPHVKGCWALDLVLGKS